jgi:hypothetical protein
MDGHRNPNNPQYNGITELITSFHDVLYQLITSPVGAVYQQWGLRMEVLPGPAYQITFDDGRRVNFRRDC